MFSEILHVPDLSHFHGQKSGDKSGYGNKSGCDKSENAQYVLKFTIRFKLDFNNFLFFFKSQEWEIIKSPIFGHSQALNQGS